MTRIEEDHAPEMLLVYLCSILSRCSTINFEYLSKVAYFYPEALGTEGDDVGDDNDDQEISYLHDDY